MATDDPYRLAAAFDNAHARLKNLRQRADEWQTFLSHFEEKKKMLAAEYKGLRAEGEEISPHDKWQELMEQGKREGFPCSESAIRTAIGGEPDPRNLDHFYKSESSKPVPLGKRCCNTGS